MKGLLVIVLGITLVALCGVGYHYWQLDGAVCSFVALFVGGGVVSSGVDLVNRSEGIVEKDDEEEEDEA